MNKPISVSTLNVQIKSLLETTFIQVYVEGEISNITHHSSGHIYFSIKDESSTLSCVMFKGNTKYLKFQLENGQKVVITGNITVYAPRGNYQLLCNKIEPSGQGALAFAFEQLKNKLEAKGYFDGNYKQPLPKYPKKIAIVTSPTGAAVRDIQMIAQRRNPYVQLVLFPALVQGAEAKESIVTALQKMDQMGMDVIILGRGGGSIEDLWAFNEEIVARAVFECQTPIITGVGHETDTTIVDYVADFRASTPSAAAEIAIFSYAEWEDKLRYFDQRFKSEMKRHVQLRSGRLADLQLKFEKKNPGAILNAKRMRLLDIDSRMKRLMEDHLNRRVTHLKVAAQRLEGASPLKKMQQGFGFLTDQKGKAVKSINEIESKQILNIELQDGKIKVEVLDIKGQGV